MANARLVTGLEGQGWTLPPVKSSKKEVKSASEKKAYKSATAAVKAVPYMIIRKATGEVIPYYK